MNFDNKLPEWKNAGTEPSDNLKTNGFQIKFKPPADIFNWFWSKTTKAITELQTKFGAHADSKNNPHGVTKEQLGLGNVNNTTDAQKNVAFASESASSRKVANKFILRFNGGSTEGTDSWTYDGSTSKSVNITPEKIGAAKPSDLPTKVSELENDAEYVKSVELPEGVQVVDNLVSTATNAALSAKQGKLLNETKAPINHNHTYNIVSETENQKKVYFASATSENGITYVANVNGITELYTGLTLIIVPNIKSESVQVTLNVNDLGAKNVRVRTGYNTAATVTPSFAGWLSAGHPVKLMFNGSMWITDITRQSLLNVYGTLPIGNGGTGVSPTTQGAYYVILDEEGALKGVVGDLPIALGGTGANNADSAKHNLGIYDEFYTKTEIENLFSPRTCTIVCQAYQNNTVDYTVWDKATRLMQNLSTSSWNAPLYNVCAGSILYIRNYLSGFASTDKYTVLAQESGSDGYAVIKISANITDGETITLS